jgi:hypothetical protein
MFRRPRDALLCLSANFLRLAPPRLKELGKLLGDQSKAPDVLDHKAHAVCLWGGLRVDLWEMYLFVEDIGSGYVAVEDCSA